MRGHWIALLMVAAMAHGALASQESHPPVQAPAAPQASEFNRSLLRFIEDDCAVRNERENHDEAMAFDSMVSFASRVPIQSFRSVARKDLTFVQLLSPETGQFRGEVIEISGRLMRNLDVGPTPALKADGVSHLFEAYIRSESQPGFGWCVFHSNTSADIPIGAILNHPVVFRGYFFKVYAYLEQGKYYRLPLLVGNALESRPMSPVPGALESVAGTMPVILVIIGMGMTLVAGLLVWLRISDSKVRMQIQRARRTVNSPLDG